jgi:NTP pyrophosphatase (non-canonical NTP hydrolase)
MDVCFQCVCTRLKNIFDFSGIRDELLKEILLNSKKIENFTMDKHEEVIKQLIEFRNERDWAQFHDSKNLALALAIEVAELNELFLWKKDKEVENIDQVKLKEELADVLAYAFLLAEKHELDVHDIVLEKIKKNGKKYPVHKAKGTAKKYNDL